MANEVYANGREISCKSGSGKTICAFPDVCMTPPENPATPPGVPVPYPNTGMTSDTTSGSKTVKVTNKEVMLKNKSYFKKSTGDEAGCAAKKGVATSVNRGKVYFTGWSMDVKIEGENAVRHLDLTTHNHASPAANTPPWPFADAMAKSKDPCKTEKDEVKKNCKDPPATDTTDKCCKTKGRQCMMVPEHKQKCCDGKTPHHAIPAADLSAPRPPKSSGKFPRRGVPIEGYDPNQAPCICVDGDDHDAEGDGTMKDHARCGTSFALERDVALYDSKTGKIASTYDYSTASEVAAQTVSDATGCDKACIKHQIDTGHARMGIGPGTTLRRSRQKGGGAKKVKAARKARGLK
jgi:hypothetical protein